MKIIGDIRPYTNQNYTYTMTTNAGVPVKVNLWQIYYGNRLLSENNTGIFKFGINTAGLSLKLAAKVRDPKTDKLVDYHINIQPLAGKPKILDLYWQDVNGAKIHNREVAYLDKVTLVVKTQNIPQGDTLKVTIYEDEYTDGHGDSSRNMGTYYTKGISKNGYAYLEFSNMSLYQKKLNKMDYVDEDTHEFYTQVHYYNKLDELKDGIPLKVKNELKQMVQPNTGNKPVVVGKVESVAKDQKKPINFTFGVFLDGTLNNMYDTEVRQLAEGKKVANASGLYVSKTDAFAIYKDHGDPKGMESSYENDLSNPAILYKNYTIDITNKIFRIYTEGIGTNTAPKEQGGTLSKEDYKDNDIMQGPAFGMGSSGIMDNVKKAITDAVKELKKIKSDQKIGTITFDVFGFSRGAAAARHFVHVVTHPAYNPKVYRGKYSTSILDLQNNPLPLSYEHKTMPHFGVLGQLLQEAGLLDAETKVNVRLVGIYDTVPHHGLFQWNDIKDLGLDNVNKADYVVHMIAADEHRANFSLVDISSVAKTSPESGKKGGIELIYPGVHCDVGGAYEEGRPDNPKRIDATTLSSSLEPLRKELIRQGWFQEDEIFIKSDLLGVATGTYSLFRLEGKRKHLSNQYSYIPLHIMAQFCTKKKLPLSESGVLTFKNFYENPSVNGITGNVQFLQRIKKKMEDYTYRGEKPLTFVEPGIYNEPPIVYATGDPNARKYIIEREERQRKGQAKLDMINDDIKFLRNHYLHWNSTYGQSGLDIAVQKNYPNIVNRKRKRHVR